MRTFPLPGFIGVGVLSYAAGGYIGLGIAVLVIAYMYYESNKYRKKK